MAGSEISEYQRLLAVENCPSPALSSFTFAKAGSSAGFAPTSCVVTAFVTSVTGFSTPKTVPPRLCEGELRHVTRSIHAEHRASPPNPRIFGAIDKPVTKWHHSGMEHIAAEPRERITARVSKRVRVTLEQAAELTGSTVNQFMVQSAYHEAQRLVERESVIRLSQEGARKVLALIDHPPKPNQRLRESAKAFKRTVRA